VLIVQALSMPLIRYRSPTAPHRSRNAGPSCRGGVSSVLRLGHPPMALLTMARALARRIKAATT
jgi:hypothetical protein